MKIAIPLVGGKMSMHFGHPEEFAFIEVNPEEKKIIQEERCAPPPHQPGMLPVWLKEQSVNVVIAGGMGAMAQQLLSQNGIEVKTCPNPETTDVLVQSYFDNSLDGAGEPCAGGH